MQIKQKFIPTSLTSTRPGLYLDPKYITVHETDNTNKGADAEAHARLQYNGNSRTASWHYSVDDTEIWQSLPDNEVGWACGDGSSGTGNRKSISIELCVNSDGNFTKTKQNAAELVAYLMKKHGIPIGNVVQHNHWSGKNCPRNLRIAGWATLISQIKTLAGSVGSSVSTGSSSSVIGRGDSGAAVTKIQTALNAKGFSVGAVDGDYGPKTETAVKAFQKSVGLTIDGIVGPLTSAKLFAADPVKYEFYDVVVNDGPKPTFSARYKDDIAEQLGKLIDKQVDKITFLKRVK